MVMICINLSYIPDDVARKINFKPGWQAEFKKNMDAFKEQFYRDTGKKWEFQNARLEADYVDFIESQEIGDPDVQKDKKVEEINEKMNFFLQKVVKHKKDKHDQNKGTGTTIN